MADVTDWQAALVVVAAGTGSRLRGDRRKALVDLGGLPLVVRTLERLLAEPRLAPVVVVGHPADRAELTGLLASASREVVLVDGGARRQDSVAAGLAALPDDVEIVLVHDAARPFVPTGRLAALVRGAAEHGCAILSLPVADTIKEARADDPRLVGRTVPRDRLRASQTPQAFRRRELARLLGRAAAEGRDVTDEAELFEAGGLAVAFVEGSPLNLKVTTPDDLRLAEAILRGLGTEAGRAERCH